MSLIADDQVTDLLFHEIPIIDLTELSKARNEQNTAARRQLVIQIRDACLRVGFFYVINHGVSEDLINKVLQCMQEFFARPPEKKMELRTDYSEDLSVPVRGYAPLLQGQVDTSKPRAGRDLHESFQFGFGGHNDSVDGWPWRDDMQQFREAALAYRQAVMSLGYQLLQLFADALELPEDWFENKAREGWATWKGLHYPLQDLSEASNHDGRSLGIGAHTDWECFTILWQQPGHQALQVKNPSGAWIDAPALPGTFVVNIAESFTRITNGIFKSTQHRVINQSGAERYSMPVFFGLDKGVLLEPIPSCVSAERPFNHEIITAGEHLRRKLLSAYASGQKY